MTEPSPAEPLYSLIRKIRKPASLRELMAACLRSVHMGDTFSREEGCLPPMPAELMQQVSLAEETISGVRCAVYTPKGSTQERALILYMHGGGFVVGCSEDTDYVTRKLCHSNQVTVVSVNYRLSPETIFPGALNDCENVLSHFCDRAASFGIDRQSVYIAGDSAGGNLAMSLSAKLRENNVPVKGSILLAPWLDMEMEKYDSYNQLAPTGIVFDAPFLAYCRASYIGSNQWKDPLVSPLYSDLANLPPTICFIGTDDSLFDQCVQLERRARQSNCNQIEVITYPGMPHCFYTFPHLFKEEQDCYERIARFISDRKKR